MSKSALLVEKKNSKEMPKCRIRDWKKKFQQKVKKIFFENKKFLMKCQKTLWKLKKKIFLRIGKKYISGWKNSNERLISALKVEKTLSKGQKAHYMSKKNSKERSKSSFEVQKKFLTNGEKIFWGQKKFLTNG